METSTLLNSSPHFSPQSEKTTLVPQTSGNLYSILQPEVYLGSRALQGESAEMAVTLFQSALLKLTVDQPFYDHLVHNLLLSYKRLIEKLIKTHDIATAREFVRAALRLEIRGRMAQDATFLRKFSGVFQDLGIVLLRNRLNQESVLCCRKVISVYPSPGSYVNLTNSLSAAGQRARLSDFTTEVTKDQLGRHLLLHVFRRVLRHFSRTSS